MRVGAILIGVHTGSIVSKHSQAAILSIFADIVVDHIAALRDAQAKLAAPKPSDEDLHQFRVTLRRLRAAWVAFAPVLPEVFVNEWKPRLRALAGSTGPVREWDVLLLEWLPAAEAALPPDDAAGRAWLKIAVKKARAARSGAWRVLRKELAATDVNEALAALEQAVRPFHIGTAPASQRAFARAQAEALRKKVIKRSRRLKRAPSAQLHRARIAAKQWRYLYEVFYPALGAQASKRRRAHLRKLQDALGGVHDADISLKRAAEVAGDAPPAIVSVFHKRADQARSQAAKQLRWVRKHRAS